MDIDWSKVLSDLNGTLTQVTAFETVRDWSQSRVLRLTCEDYGRRVNRELKILSTHMPL